MAIDDTFNNENEMDKLTLKFTDPVKLKEYFSGDRITCLLCGKTYKSLGHHVSKTHNMHVDDYKEMYGIPWTYGLTCEKTKENYGVAPKRRMADGEMPWVGDKNRDMTKVRKNLKTQRKRQPIRKTLVEANLKKMNEGCTGEYTRKKALMTKRGSTEYHEKMKNRPQCKFFFKANWCKGKKQSPEHIAKRIANGIKTRSKKLPSKKMEDKICALYLTGVYSIVALSKKLKVGRARIAIILKGRNIVVKNRSFKK